MKSDIVKDNIAAFIVMVAPAVEVLQNYSTCNSASKNSNSKRIIEPNIPEEKR